MTRKIPFNVLKNRPMIVGDIHTKDDKQDREAGLETLTKELSTAVDTMAEFKTAYDADAKVIKELRDSVESLGKVDGETKAKLEEYGTSLADNMAKFQAFEEAVETIKKEMEQPRYNEDKLAEKDRQNAVELQKRAFVFKGGAPEDFKADMDDLVDPAHLRSASAKLMGVGLESKRRIIASLTADEKKAFEAASLDTAFFMPEMLGIEVDCEIECASLLDLYQQVSVSRSTFLYPHVTSYGDIGQYDCDSKCDAEYGPEGNITWKHGQSFDFRGVFCFQRDTLREANYDLLGFMFRSAARSYRINRNEALITGDGVNQPMGWLTADVFTKVAAPQRNPTHQDLRQFLASAPVEYGPVTAAMHQNTFAYFASMIDNNGRFIYGDGLMGFSPDDVVDRIRISNCLPDPTDGGTKGSDAAQFDAGAFIMAAGVWSQAYASVNHRPMFMEQYEGGSTAWCVKYQFGAKDGGFVACAPAARTFEAGA